MDFRLEAPYSPNGDQPTAIETLVEGVEQGQRYQTLLGATGTGKTFSIANVIQRTGRPALVLAHNKTLAAQLSNELRQFFPHNAVEYFISYYDYYQPEAHVPVSDTYIAKTASINEEIDMLRHSATRSLFERRDVIVVASISCIYGLDSSEYLKARAIQCWRNLEFAGFAAGAGQQPVQPQRHRNRPRPFSRQRGCARDRARLRRPLGAYRAVW